MAYPISVGSIVEVTFPYRVNSQLCMAVLHYKLRSGSVSDGATNLQALLTDLNAVGGLHEAMSFCQSEDATYPELRAQVISPLRFVPETQLSNRSQGAITEPCNNQQVAIAVTKRSELASRHGIGTLHLGGIADTFCTAGRVASAFGSIINLFAGQLNDDVTLTGSVIYDPVIYNRSNPSLSAVITTASYQDTLRTMRRRVVGRGI